MEKKDKRWAVIQACKRPCLLNLMEGKRSCCHASRQCLSLSFLPLSRSLRWKNKLEIKRCRNATKGYAVLFGCWVSFSRQPRWWFKTYEEAHINNLYCKQDLNRDAVW